MNRKALGHLAARNKAEAGKINRDNAQKAYPKVGQRVFRIGLNSSDDLRIFQGIYRDLPADIDIECCWRVRLGIEADDTEVDRFEGSGLPLIFDLLLDRRFQNLYSLAEWLIFYNT